MSGRILHAQLHLLDRQLLDLHSGRMLGKIDDVELDLDAEVPVVTGLISGRQRIPANQVAEIGSAVKILNQDLELDRHDDRVEQHVIDKIPGAGNATE
jgi:sporulation protein YlmC with PRC-barrel domain